MIIENRPEFIPEPVFRPVDSMAKLRAYLDLSGGTVLGKYRLDFNEWFSQGKEVTKITTSVTFNGMFSATEVPGIIDPPVSFSGRDYEDGIIEFTIKPEFMRAGQIMVYSVCDVVFAAEPERIDKPTSV